MVHHNTSMVAVCTVKPLSGLVIDQVAVTSSTFEVVVLIVFVGLPVPLIMPERTTAPVVTVSKVIAPTLDTVPLAPTVQQLISTAHSKVVEEFPAAGGV